MMTTDLFWTIIEEANIEAGSDDQPAFLKSVTGKLAKLSAVEIAAWKSIQTYLIKLADRIDLMRAAEERNIYLSDDSFYDFRAWLLSKGKEKFGSVLREPERLSELMDDPKNVYFERFSYVSHDIYRERAYAEENGEDALKRLEEEWRTQNPSERDFDSYWMLYDKYDIYDACDMYPLSDTEKEKLRQEIFPPIEKETIHWMKKEEAPSVVEQAVLKKIPQEKEYRRISIELNSGYAWGSGMLPAAKERFHREMKDLFTAAGWEFVAPEFDTASPSYRKGSSLLYCHPMELSGPCDEVLMLEVVTVLGRAAHCTVLSYKDEGRVYDMTDEQYTEILHGLKTEIEKDLLKAFSEDNTIPDSDRCASVMGKYRIMTLDRTTNVLSSNCPYWKCIEETLKELIKQKKIIPKPDATKFSSQHYMTAPEFMEEKREKIDYRIRDAVLRNGAIPKSDGKKMTEREL